MKAATTELAVYLNALRNGDASAIVVNLFTLTLRGGQSFYYASSDVPITWNGVTYSASSILGDGLKYKASAGVEVDQQIVTIAARPTDTLGNQPFLKAVRQGALDGAHVIRHMAFLSDWNLPPVGAVMMFSGRVGEVNDLGATSCEITVNSDLILLDIDMPRRVYGPDCQHVLYDGGCKVNKAAFTFAGIAESGSWIGGVKWAAGGDLGPYLQGSLTFTSGEYAGVIATINWIDNGAHNLGFAYPLVGDNPAAGDTFVVSYGCDHTLATCADKFANRDNFFGFPWVPPPVAEIKVQV